MATTHRSDLVDELEKALRDEVCDGGFGALLPEQLTDYVRTLAVTAAAVVAEKHTSSVLPAEADATESESGADGGRADHKKRDTAPERHQGPEHDEPQADDQKSRDVPGRDAGRHAPTVAVKQEGADDADR